MKTKCNCLTHLLARQLKRELKKVNKLEVIKPKFKTNAKF